MLLDHIIYSFKRYIHNEEGSGVVEIAIIIVILVVLAMFFQEQITGVLTTIIDKITSKVNGIG